MFRANHSTIIEIGIIEDTFFQEFITPLVGDRSNNPDYYELKIENKQSIGIKEARELVNWLQLKPFQAKYKVALVLEADKLTIEAQNSLLKTLEEPPANSFIFLITKNHKSLIPTIVSRSELIRLKSQKLQENSLDIESVKKLISSNPDVKFKWVDKIHEVKNPVERKQIIADFLNNLYLYTKQQSNINTCIVNLKLIEKTYEGLRRNVNIKLLLENLLLNYQN